MTRSLYLRVLVAIALGIALGVLWPRGGAAMQPLGEGFIRIIKMTIAPLIFCTVVTGIGEMKTMKSVGKAGGLALIYFEVASTIALVIGMIVVNVVGPGRGMDLDVSKLDRAAVAKYAPHEIKGVADFLLDVIPDSLFGGLARGDVLPTLFAAIVFGFAAHRAGERARPILDLVQRLGHIIFEVVTLVMKLAPIGAFGAMAFTVGSFGADRLWFLLILMGCFYATCLIFIFGVLGVVARVHGFSIFRFVRYIRDELFIVLGTSSSESVLPRMMAKLEDLGAGRPTVGLVIPAGYSFNLDGTAIYLTMAAVFIAQATNTQLGLEGQLEILAVLLLTSKGAAGVTGSGLATLSGSLGAIGGIPVAGVVQIAGIDRFMSEARALTNVIGNGVATLVVARWCNDLDLERLRAKLAAGPPTDIPSTASAHPEPSSQTA